MNSTFLFPLLVSLPDKSNIPADSPEARNLMVPFIDHITTELEARFGPIHQTKVKLLGLIPSVAANYPLVSVKAVGEMYKADLPSAHLLSTGKFALPSLEEEQIFLQKCCQQTRHSAKSIASM